jgi:predicted restriction endonuclease
MDTCTQYDHWLRVAANLKVDRARGPAPHKPLLLLVVAGLAEEDRLGQPVLPLTGELGYRCVTVDAGSIVDAAHIHQFADSRNNDPRNGIALCKNAHWLFDQGLWSLTDDYRVLIAANRFDEAGDAAHLLKRLEGGRIRLPTRPDCWPDRTHLAWHRRCKLRTV